MRAPTRRRIRVTAASACAFAALLASASGGTAQEATFTLRGYSRVADIPTIGTVADFPAVEARKAVNPFRYDCVANLEIVDESGARVSLDGDLEPTQVRILSNGASRNARTAEMVALRDQNRRIIVLLSMDGDPERVAFSVEEARARGDSGSVDLPDLRSAEFDIPDDVRRRCGTEPRVDLDLQEPTAGSEGLALNLDAVKRIPFNGAGGGLWEFSASGSALGGDSAVTLDSWQGESRVQWNVSPWPDRWIGVGLTGRLEATEDLRTINGLIGAAVQVRLDFLGLDELLAPLVTRFTPYPFFVAEYNVGNDLRSPSLAGDTTGIPRPVNNRLDMGVEWRVPFLFDTTVNVALRGSYLFGGLPEGEDTRWRTLKDISVEYPITSAGDVVAVLTRLSGETAPLFRRVSRSFLGIGIRR